MKTLRAFINKLIVKVVGWGESLHPTYTIYQGHLTRKFLSIESVCLLCNKKVIGTYTPRGKHVNDRCPKLMDVEQFQNFALHNLNSTILMVIDKRTEVELIELPYLGFVSVPLDLKVLKEFYLFDRDFKRKDEEDEQQEILKWLLG